MRTQINGYIVADEDAWIYRWAGYQVCSPRDIRQAIADNPPGETLTVEINNRGGDMFSGFEIYSVLRGASCPTEAEVQSLSASAASIAMLGCRRVKATPVAQVMIHNPAVWADGNQYEHQKTAEDLTKFAQSILNAYELKCAGRRTREELAAMMDAETWMTVQEAMEAGLVDEVIGDGGVLLPGGQYRVRRPAGPGWLGQSAQCGGPACQKGVHRRGKPAGGPGGTGRQGSPGGVPVPEKILLRRKTAWILQRF